MELRLRVRLVGLLAGPVIGLIVFLALPADYVDERSQTLVLSHAARAAAGVGIWMAVWWMTEAISVYATALIPLGVFPLLGAATIKDAAASYGHELIYLFLGGFVLALALERWGLHRRVALQVLGVVGTRPLRIVAAFMGIAAFVSMWVTNTATTIMLLPVALSVIRMVGSSDSPGDGRADDDRSGNFAICLLLGIAYAASIGGVGTLIGTAPNVFLASFIQSQMGTEISFARWMMIGLPLVVIFVPIVWWVLGRVAFPVSGAHIQGIDAMVSTLQAELGPMSRGEKLTLVVFLLTASSWVLRPVLNQLSVLGFQPLVGLTDAGVAVIAALLLFVIPVRAAAGEFLMDWQTAVRLPWGLLILFGGGLSLAATLDNTGFSAFLGSRAVVLEPLPTVLIVALVTGMMIFLTELTSNTATTATLIPVLYAVSVGLKLNPYLIIVPAAIAASCAFMLPVATPPNAIVFGSGMVTVPQMTRAGLWLNILGILLITTLTYSVIVPVLALGA
jgi:sodium-dependent dicarboxylate transporter 2/3/5